MKNLLIIFFLSFVCGLEAQTVIDNIDRSMVGNVDNSVNAGETYNGIRTLHFGVEIIIDYINSKVTIGEKEFKLIAFTSIKDGEVITINGGKLTLIFNIETFKVDTLFVEGIKVKGLKADYIGSH
jgi:hypothetical protein